MKTVITILFYVFGILATLYGVNTAVEAKHAAEARKPDIKLSMPLVKDVQQATKVQNHGDQLNSIKQTIKKVEDRLAAIEDFANSIKLRVDSVEDSAKHAPVVPEKPNTVVVDPDEPKVEAPVAQIQVLEYSLPDNQCPACVVLERDVLGTKEFQALGYNVSKGANPKKFGVQRYPTIVTYNAEKNTYYKFQAAGMSTLQVVANIKNGISKIK